MGKVFKAIRWICGIIFGFGVVIMQTPFEDAKSNLSGWLEHIPNYKVPEILRHKNVDTYGTVIFIILLTITFAAPFILKWLKRKKAQNGKKAQKGKKITVNNGSLSLTTQLSCRIDHGKAVSHFVSLKLKNETKKTLKHVKLIVSGSDIFIEKEIRIDHLHPGESGSITSDAVYMDKRTGEIVAYLTDVKRDKVLSFFCDFSCENVKFEHVIFGIYREKDIYENMEMILVKLSKN